MLEIILHVVLEFQFRIENCRILKQTGTWESLATTLLPALFYSHHFKASRRVSFRSGSHHITPLSKFSTGFPLLLEESSSSSFPIECPWDLSPCHLSDPTPCIPFCQRLVPQPHHFSCEGTSTPSSFPSQIFCASCSLCWKHSSPDLQIVVTFSSLRSQLEHHFLSFLAFQAFSPPLSLTLPFHIFWPFYIFSPSCWFIYCQSLSCLTAPLE